MERQSTPETRQKHKIGLKDTGSRPCACVKKIAVQLLRFGLPREPSILLGELTSEQELSILLCRSLFRTPEQKERSGLRCQVAKALLRYMLALEIR